MKKHESKTIKSYFLASPRPNIAGQATINDLCWHCFVSENDRGLDWERTAPVSDGPVSAGPESKLDLANYGSDLDSRDRGKTDLKPVQDRAIQESAMNLLLPQLTT